VLEHERGAERKGERDGGRWFLNTLGRAAEVKRGRQGVQGQVHHAAWGLAPTYGQHPNRWAAPRPWLGRGSHGRHALFRIGAGGAGSMTRETQLSAGEEGMRERHGARVGRLGKERGEPSSGEQ
jgi:hypothetical protein